jgi:hypothetical protein
MRRWYKVHKWLAVTAGVGLLIWLISGVVMVLPPLFPPPPIQKAPVPLALHEAILTPAEAVAAFARTTPKPPQVQSVTLKRLAEVPVYSILPLQGEAFLIDARSGAPFRITSDIAEQIARRHVPQPAQVAQSGMVTRYSTAYPWGPLPAHRFVFSHDPATTYYVAAAEGTVHNSNRWVWLKGVIGSLHTFEPIKLITRDNAIRKGLLILGGLAGLGATCTGYYLAWPR